MAPWPWEISLNRSLGETSVLPPYTHQAVVRSMVLKMNDVPVATFSTAACKQLIEGVGLMAWIRMFTFIRPSTCSAELIPTFSSKEESESLNITFRTLTPKSI